MRNIEIRIYKDGIEIDKYISDIVPNVDDYLSYKGSDYKVYKRTFIASNNRVIVHIEAPLL